MLLSGFVLIELAPGFSPAAPPETAQQRENSAATDKPPVFETDVAPLFKSKCSRCHGEKERKADLDLGSPAAILKGGESGPAIVPKDLEKSLLYEKVAAGEMPPGKKDRLTETELAIIRRWIEAGAPANSDAPQADAVTQHDVIPILLRRCTVCHGARRQEGGLDLRTKASMLRGGKSGPAIVL
jgi:mono/diheme cytochrome c family protein